MTTGLIVYKVTLSTMQTKKQKPNARVLVWDSTLRRIKVHARHAGQFIYRYIDELVPPMPAAVKRKVRK